MGTSELTRWFLVKRLHMYTSHNPRQSASTRTPLAVAQALQAIHTRGSGLDPKNRQVISRSISTSFNALRIRHVRSQRSLAGTVPSGRTSGSDVGWTLMEEYENFVTLPFVRYGIHLSQQTRYGSILPALRIYHIVDDIDSLYYTKCSGSIQDFQKAVDSGLVHPFTRDRHHRSLLHVSV